MKGSAILLIVLICSVIAPSYAKATKKHPILQRRSLISLKDDFITPINANANSTIVKRDDNKNSNETAQKQEIINDRTYKHFKRCRRAYTSCTDHVCCHISIKSGYFETEFLNCLPQLDIVSITATIST